MLSEEFLLKEIGSGDCGYVNNILSDDELKNMFYLVKKEIDWKKMSHKGGDVPRLISIQSSIEKKDTTIKMPLYRHPLDEHPKQVKFTKYVKILKDRTEDKLGLPRNYFNHCLVQLYSGGTSHISDHTDKTLDITRGTYIINVSLGAVRYLKIKNKIKDTDESKKSVKIKMENGSIFILGWNTNREFYHGINQDKRENKFKEKDEIAFDSERISLTFRNIATFIDEKGNITGQGAPKDTTIKVDDATDALNMLKAFSKENRDRDFDWELNYGSGFNAIGFKILEK